VWLCGGTSTDSVVLLLVIFCSSLSLFVMAMFNWHHAECVNIGCIPDDQYICSSCTALNITIPYEETEHKQLMVENIAITNNDKEEQNITKSKTTESVEVPPHSHTTQATNALDILWPSYLEVVILH
jgi:hypothetical protein